MFAAARVGGDLNYPRSMVSVDTHPLGVESSGGSIRPYATADFAWAVELLEATGGRHRVRRGVAVDMALLPGLVALRNSHPTALLTLTRHLEELEFSVVASAPFDDVLVGELLEAGMAYAGPQCRRVWTICSNADFDVQRALQQSDFRLCTVRPGMVDSVTRRSPTLGLKTELGGVAVRDEVEFDRFVS